MGRTTVLSAVLTIALGLGSFSCRKQDAIKVGSKNFTEQLVLAEIVAQHLEKKAGAPVERRFGLGGTLLANQALQAGEIDMYPEYTGTALTSILKVEPLSDPSVVLERVRQEYRVKMQAEWLEPLGFNNSFAMVIRGEDARAKNIETISQAVDARPEGWRLGVGYEFQERPDGLPSLRTAYKLPIKGTPRAMDLGLMFQALTQGSVDMIAANMTDGLLGALDVKVLADDRASFPPYEAAVVVRQDALEKHPALRATLAALSGKISAEAMRKMNYEVDGKKRTPGDVAADFLKRAGI